MVVKKNHFRSLIFFLASIAIGTLTPFSNEGSGYLMYKVSGLFYQSGQKFYPLYY
jgi:hypothetical protein